MSILLHKTLIMEYVYIVIVRMHVHVINKTCVMCIPTIMVNHILLKLCVRDVCNGCNLTGCVVNVSNTD